MSIWCSREHIGHDGIDRKVRGEVRTYAEGFSNHYPSLSETHELPAVIALASIPSWCVPGHDDEDYDAYGEWIRLSINADAGISFWEKPPTRERVDACVVLDETAARYLRDQLTEWLDAPKLKAEHHDTETRTG